jgi:hypothetical protein
VPWNPKRRSIRPHLEVDDLTRLATEGRWPDVVDRARTWLDAWPNDFPPYEWMFIGVSHRDGIPAAESWARDVLPRTTGTIHGYLCASIVLHGLVPVRVGDWSDLDPSDREAELVGMAETAWRDSRAASRWAACALPVVRAFQGECEVARAHAAEALATHHLQPIERGWIAAVNCLADAGDGKADSARNWLGQLRDISPSSRYIAAAEASLEIAEAGGLAAYRQRG